MLHPKPQGQRADKHPVGGQRHEGAGIGDDEQPAEDRGFVQPPDVPGIEERKPEADQEEDNNENCHGNHETQRAATPRTQASMLLPSGSSTNAP